MANLTEVSGHKLESSQIWVFVWVFYPNFSVLQNAIQESTQVFWFVDFLVKIFKTREGYMISIKSASRRDCEMNSMEQRTKVFY
jgi:hypothetical protein